MFDRDSRLIYESVVYDKIKEALEHPWVKMTIADLKKIGYKDVQNIFTDKQIADNGATVSVAVLWTENNAIQELKQDFAIYLLIKQGRSAHKEETQFEFLIPYPNKEKVLKWTMVIQVSSVREYSNQMQKARDAFNLSQTIIDPNMIALKQKGHSRDDIHGITGI